MNKTFCISDLHLSKNTPHVALLFQYFLAKIFKPGDTLLILGDFFEYYLGEDLIDSIQEGALQKLKQLHTQGSKLFFMPGNRDFLFKQKTLQQYGITLLQDPTLYEAYGKKILLTHGDRLCTKDRPYQRYRKLVRSPIIKWLFLHFPKTKRIQIAEKIHAQNPHGNFIKDPNYNLADATPEAITKDIKRYSPHLLIYGHVHKMAEAQHGQTKRLVLGDWHRTGNYIEISAQETQATVFSLSG